MAEGSTNQDDNGPRGILRGFEILMAAAQEPEGITFTSLRECLRIPKASLHRLLRSLEQERYLIQRSGSYFLGAESTRLSGLIARATHAQDFPASVAPVTEWLARESGETVVIGIMNEKMTEVVYVQVVTSEAPLRINVPVGNRRPLYSAASGKVLLAFMPSEFQRRYIAETKFERITPFTSSAEEISAILETVRRSGIAHDLNGSFIGVSGLASPGFDGTGMIRCAISVVGPMERMEGGGDRVRSLTLEAGERVSRILGYLDEYPPPSI